ncbi:hypothetical protein D3C84_772280 [compost metagenome]
MENARPCKVPIIGQTIGKPMHSKPTHQSILMFCVVQVSPRDRRRKNKPVRYKAKAERLAGISSRPITRPRARCEGW